MATVIVADDYDVIREGIKNILSETPEYEVVAEAATGEEVLEKVEKLKPDFLLLDITMPQKSGLDIIEQLLRISPETKVIIVTMHRAHIYIAKAFKLGVKGYLHKENVVEDLVSALRRVGRGEVYVSSQLSQYLIERITNQEGNVKKVDLTARENDILRLVVEGMTAKEIAEALFISTRTVENYKNALLKKLGLHKTADLIKYAIKYKIVEIE